MINPTKQENRDYALDLIKIICCGIILLHHYQQDLNVYFNHFNFYCGEIKAWLGVEMFFFISGLLSAKYVDKIQNGARLWDTFLHKYKRLIPVTAISTFACFFFELLSHQLNTPELIVKHFINTLSVSFGINAVLTSEVSVNNPLWYVSILLFCFLVLLIISSVFKAKSHKDMNTIFLILVISGCVLEYCLWGSFGKELPILNRCVGRGLTSFFYGVLFSREQKTFAKIPSIALIVLLIGSEIILHKTIVIPEIFFTIIICPLIVLLCQRITPRLKLPGNIIINLSSISFSVYCWHCLVLMIMSTLNFNYGNRMMMLLYLIIMVVIGSLSYYGIERRFNLPKTDRSFK